MVRTLVATLCLASLTCVGCSSSDANLGEVTGKVTMDGTAMPNVLVTFNPVDGGRSSSAATKDDGTYTLGYGQEAGAEVGIHKVSVTTLGTQKETVDSEMTSDSPEYQAQAMGSSASDYDNATVVEAIPPKYNTATTLQYEVKSGSNTIDIELTK